MAGGVGGMGAGGMLVVRTFKAVGSAPEGGNLALFFLLVFDGGVTILGVLNWRGLSTPKYK